MLLQAYLLSINQDIDSGRIAVTDTDRQEAITNLIQRFVKEKKEPNPDNKWHLTK